MDIKVEKSKISATQLSLLQNFEQSLKQVILNAVNSEKCRHIAIQFGCAVIEKKPQQVVINHNASFGLEGSYYLVDMVNEEIKKSNMDVIIPNYTLQIDLIMERKETIQKPSSSQTEEVTFSPIEPKFNFDQIILPESVRTEIFDSIKLIEVKDLIYKKWGYGDIEPVAKSVINMYGPAGTGKTMCAHAIAKKLNKKLLALNYSEIESKYLGEAAKNLKKAFETAVKTDSVIFFDEADSFLGKRVQNVSHSSDQALNSLRSQMLILLEEHEGIVLFATNLVSNFDSAFNSRIQKHIRFELPNKEARALIIKKQVPKRLPLDQQLTDDDFLSASELAEGLSGREIKNAMLELYLSKADIHNADIVFTIDDIRNAIKKKKDSITELEEERKRMLKEKIIRKFEEKVEEDKAEEEYRRQRNRRKLKK